MFELESVALMPNGYFPTGTVEAKVPVIVPALDKLNPEGRFDPGPKLQVTDPTPFAD
jgi:hypothetical protein